MPAVRAGLRRCGAANKYDKKQKRYKMATKKETISMVDTFKEFNESKHIDRTTLVSVLEESFRNVIAKIYGSDENFDVIVNPDKGDFEIYRNRVVVADGEVQDENKEISLSDAREIEGDYEVGEDVSERVDFAKFGRRAILNLRQTLSSKILELEHDSLYNKYKDRVGQVISAEVYQVWKREVLLVDDDNNELILPKSEQIQRDIYHKGETIRAVILRVDNENNNPKIILSRTSPVFLERLLEAEGQGGSGKLRRAHRPGWSVRRRKRRARARHSARAVQREHRRDKLHVEQQALHTAVTQPGEGVEPQHRRREHEGRGVSEARGGVARHWPRRP